MTMPKISKNKILLIALIIVAVIGYYMFKGPNEEALTNVESDVAGSIGMELVVEVNRLRGLQNIEGRIFQDPSYRSLQDFTQAVTPQPLGRSNPLAPIGGEF